MKFVIVALGLLSLIQFPKLVFSQTKKDSVPAVSFSNFPNNPNVSNGNLILKDQDGNVIFDQSKNVANLELYEKFSRMGDELLSKRDFFKAMKMYETALVVNLDVAKVKHRLNLAKCYCAIGKNDSAFKQLFWIAEKSHYYFINELETEPLFEKLKDDDRWGILLELIKANKERADRRLNKDLEVVNKAINKSHL